MIAGMASISAIRQSRIAGTVDLAQASWLKTEKTGRFAGLGKSAVKIGTTRDASSPANLKISNAKSNHVV